MAENIALNPHQEPEMGESHKILNLLHMDNDHARIMEHISQFYC